MTFFFFCFSISRGGAQAPWAPPGHAPGRTCSPYVCHVTHVLRMSYESIELLWILDFKYILLLLCLTAGFFSSLFSVSYITIIPLLSTALPRHNLGTTSSERLTFLVIQRGRLSLEKLEKLYTVNLNNIPDNLLDCMD